MAKLFKTEMYILDIDDDFESLEEILNYLEYKSSNYPVSFNPFNTEEVEFEWDDDIDLNYTNVTLNTYRKYFNN